MSRQKKSRCVSDIMPTRKSDQKSPKPLFGKKLSRYELDAKAREQKRKRKQKGLTTGSRHSASQPHNSNQMQQTKDPRIGSRKKVPLMVEFVNKPEKGLFVSAAKMQPQAITLDPMQELEQLENDLYLNDLLDQLEAGNKITADEQKFLDENLTRIAQLLQQLGIEDEQSEDDLYRTFEKIDINRFR